MSPALKTLPSFSHPWTPDQGDGTYFNPVIHADYSDPDVVRVGEDFYLTASSFNCTPGLPILHSRDLVNWTLINHAVKNLPHPRFEAVQPGCGIWAPAIRQHNGRFWIFFPMPDEGIYMTTADHPSAKWTEPHLVEAGKGLIDPCPFWDEDGSAWLVHAYAASRSGIKHKLRVRPMAPDGSRLLDEGRIVFDAPDRHPTLEGPKFHKKDGWYYLLAPAGGVVKGWQVALRSRHIYGPYEDRIVLEQGSSAVNGPHQGALVDVPGGGWWFVHFQDAGVYGRIVHLQPVTWRNGWPLMGVDRGGNGVREPVRSWHKPKTRQPSPVAIPATSDEFNGETLGLQWQWHANHRDDWFSLRTRPGWLRLFSQAAPEDGLEKSPNLLLQKFPARAFAVETLLEFAPGNAGEQAGLMVMGSAHAALALKKTGGGSQLVLSFDNAAKFAREVPGQSVRLRMQVRDGGVCQFSYSTGADWIAIPENFQARQGVWIGAKVGLFSQRPAESSQGGHADFDYFRFSTEGIP